MSIIHALLGFLTAGGCFVACCVSLFSTLVTLINGLPVTLMDTALATVGKVLTSQRMPSLEDFAFHQSEALVLVVG